MSRIERCRHMSPLLRGRSFVDLINSVSNKRLESSLLVGDVLKDGKQVCPKCDTMNRLIVNQHMKTHRDHSCL